MFSLEHFRSIFLPRLEKFIMGKNRKTANEVKKVKKLS